MLNPDKEQQSLLLNEIKTILPYERNIEENLQKMFQLRLQNIPAEAHKGKKKKKNKKEKKIKGGKDAKRFYYDI